MKKLLIISAAVLMSTAAMAQTVRSYRSTATDANGLVYTLPRTSLIVNVVTQRESVRKGPYARFAQKYFGMLAPLADKDVYSIVDAQIKAFEEADPSQVYVLANSEKSPVDLYRGSSEGVIALGIDGQGSAPDLFAAKESDNKCYDSTYSQQDTSFMSVPISRTEVMQSSLEEQAAAAAEALFSLRRRRIELITGDQGEYVFGAGLGDALKEIDRLEQEYIALFFGKTFTKTIVNSYNVGPEAGKNTIIVCRFSETVGAMPTSDLSGTPIVLELTPENKAKSSVLPLTGAKDDRDKVYVRVADVVSCRLVDSNKTIVQERLPIFQFGQVIQAPMSAVK